MSALSQGYYVLTVWAAAGDANAATVRSNFKAQYGEDVITNIGSGVGGLSYSTLQQVFRDSIDNGADPENPTLAQINGGILKAGGTTPSILSSVVSGVSDAAKETGQAAAVVAGGTLTALKYLSIIVAVGGAFYLAWKFDALGKVKRA